MVSSELRTEAGAQLVGQSACYLPTSQDSLPLIGALSDCHGAYIATGHTCMSAIFAIRVRSSITDRILVYVIGWGILNAPATGESLSAMIAGVPLVDGAAPLEPFDPARFTRAHSSYYT
jgi:glycine/D-amino acid oxidase-like deaminating enzyme